MKNGRHYSALKSFLILALFIPLSQAEEPLKYRSMAAHITSPDQYQKLFENDQVVVLRMALMPGESDNVHVHRDETVYFEKGGVLQIKSEGKVIEADIPDGHVMWHSSWEHQVRNIGTTTVVAVIVESKN